MKNIKIFLLFFLYMQLIFSCEKKEYTIVPLNHQVIEITSREGLYRLAYSTQNEWNELSQHYRILPSALVEYICPDIDSDGYHNVEYVVQHYQEKNEKKKKYDALIEEIFAEIRNENQNELVLEVIRKKFNTECIKEAIYAYQEIKDIMPDYENKRATYVCRMTISMTIAILLLCGWIPVGLFSWVINHCHNNHWGE